MARSRAARRRARRNIALGTVFLAVATAVIGGVAYFMLHRDAPLAEVTFCPAKGPNGYIALLVDKTDPLTFTQRQAFLELMRQIAASVQPGELIEVFALDEDYRGTAEPLLRICNPGDGKDANPLDSNPEKLQKQYLEHFQAPLQKLADQLQTTKSAKYSPLFEMLQIVSVNGIQRNGVQGKKRLIVVSDMLHNTPRFSMYKEMPAYEAFAASDYAKKLETRFQGAEVQIVYLMNDPQRQTRRHAHFWEQYFAGHDAHVVRVRLLEG